MQPFATYSTLFPGSPLRLRWRRLLCIVCSACALLALLHKDAAAQVEAALEDLASRDGDRMLRALGTLAKSDDDRAAEVLRALNDSRLRLSRDGEAWIESQDGRWLSLRTSQAATASEPPGETPLVNNRLRRRASEALSRAELRSKRVEVRRAAAEELAEGARPSQIPALREALQSETDAETRAALRLAIASVQLTSNDPSEQLAALNAVQEAGAARYVSAVTALAQSADADPDVRARAQRVKGSLERRMLWLSGVANLFYGLSLGSVLLLAALGLAITFGLMRVINMAHGEMLMVGAYATYVVQNLVRDAAPSLFEWYLLLALPAAFGTCALLGVLLERTVIRFLYGRPLETLLATWGISLILIQTVRLVFGAQNVSVENPSWLSGGWELAPTVVLPYSRIVVILFSVIVVAFVWALLQKTRLGIYVRAVTQNREMAGSLGVPTRRIDVWTFALGSGVAGLGGVALSQLGNVGPELGKSYIVDSFMVVVLGGVGNVVGTIAGALGLGVANKFLEPATGAVLGKILLLVLLILFIQWRPQGMFAPKGRAAEL